MEYRTRLIEKTISKFIEGLPVILIEGAKGVGKTETCKRYSNTEYSLNKVAQKDLIESNPTIILKDNPPVLVDEWQKVPQFWDELKDMVDGGLKDGSVLLTGSSPRFYRDLHSGAGRIVMFKMRPFSIEERDMSQDLISLSSLLDDENYVVEGKTQVSTDDYLDEIFRSGFPGIRTKGKDEVLELLKAYINAIVTHDFEEHGIIVKKPGALMEWMRAYASVTATITSFSSILEIAMANNLDAPTRVTGNTYREALQMLNIIDEVPSWLPFGKISTNLSKVGKHFMMDTALMTTLLNVKKEDLKYVRVPKEIGRYNKTFLGQIFESFVYQSLRVYTDVRRCELAHYRSKRGDREIDFIIQDGRTVIAIEVKAKLSVSASDIEHLEWFEKQIQEEYRVIKMVVYLGQYAYTNKEEVHIIPAAMLGF